MRMEITGGSKAEKKGTKKPGKKPFRESQGPWQNNGRGRKTEVIGGVKREDMVYK